MTGLLGALAEAWGQVRVHRVRFVLSLLGVFVAVFAMTSATAVGRMGQQMVNEAFEAAGGRSATIEVNVTAGPDGEPSPAALREQFTQLRERYQIRYSSIVEQSSVKMRLPDGLLEVSATKVEPAYGEFHRLLPKLGRWFTEADLDRLSPAVVVNQLLATKLGLETLARPVALTLAGEPAQTVTIVGVVEGDPFEDQMFLSQDPPIAAPGASGDASADGGGGGGGDTGDASVGFEAWVPPAKAQASIDIFKRDLTSACSGCQVEAQRVDAGNATSELDGLLGTGVQAAGLLLLGIGALGVLNVAILTVRERIREIGIRRAIGASSARIFSAVLLESALATSLVGAFAVLCSIALVTNLPIGSWLGEGLSLADPPPFPIEVALQGALAAVGVGLLAGLVPATIAVRSNIIEAIRF